jgi:hypothetical protein
MPIKVQINGQDQWLKANTEWQRLSTDQKAQLNIDSNFM